MVVQLLERFGHLSVAFYCSQRYWLGMVDIMVGSMLAYQYAYV